MELKTIREANFSGKKVVMRVDFNVPMKEGVVQDDTRIKAALGSIEHILAQNPRYLVLMSHLGDPKKDLKKAKEKAEKDGKTLDEEAFTNGKNRIKPVSEYLSKLLNKAVIFSPNTTGSEVKTLCEQSAPGSIIMLENTRFDSRETSKEATERESMAKELAELGDIYVNDAFGTAHRAHASTETLAHFLPAYAGLLMEKEVAYLDPIVSNPQKPMVAIVGGAKVSSKIAVLESLLKNAHSLIIGGGMAFTFLKAQGHTVGKSLVEDDFIDTAKALLIKAKEMNVEILLPVDHLAAPEFADVTPTYVDAVDLPDNLMGLDAGAKSVALYSKALQNAKTVVWNGPLGVFEFKNFEFGTHEIAKVVASIKANGGISVVGGGDSVAAVNKFGLADQMSHVSTGGGASLEYLEGKALPGIVALKK
ncbi:phosphoglycerate kinase [Entomospira nematocerorum]|uniref:Phosphoglycerate kinase n=1 Tax=Entomospira nematocerorum TaxID=2719987 RepID=A0A968GEK9_9SPIO|nr:phosphoglycerate kinase [Entomospira nematocera]NIZ46768.1 phosphoglycerate kinase [Entomospira nematocera]WDI33435.1 phosphoglycerate kinase [Entomospira nematocera]